MEDALPRCVLDNSLTPITCHYAVFEISEATCEASVLKSVSGWSESYLSFLSEAQALRGSGPLASGTFLFSV